MLSMAKWEKDNLIKSNKMNLIIKAIKQKLNKTFNSPYRKVGIGLFTEKIIKHSNNRNLKSIKILGHKTWYKNSHELLHSLDELFFSEIYKFKSKKEVVRILDCGSNIGLSILYFKSLFKNAIIKGFEPDNQNFELLNKNIQEWGFADIDIHKAAIWTTNGSINFSQTGSMGSQITQTESIDAKDQTKCIRLKELLNEPVDFLKMDIEGAEHEVLLDCGEQLKMASNIFIEYHGKFSENHKLIEILQLLDGLDFQFYIKEAADNFKTPFSRDNREIVFEVQLNIFAFSK